MRALDVGAVGVILPLIDNAAEAARGVEACRYPPHGRRSYGPVRAQLVIGSGSTDDLNAESLCFAMIETREGLDNLDEIAATPGLDGLYIGPSDLAIALDLPPQRLIGEPGEDRPALAEAIERIRQACEANGLIAGMQCGSGARRRLLREQRLPTDHGRQSTPTCSESAISSELSAARGA